MILIVTSYMGYWNPTKVLVAIFCLILILSIIILLFLSKKVSREEYHLPKSAPPKHGKIGKPTGLDIGPFEPEN